MRHHQTLQAGFTLVEMIVVLTIAGLMSVVVMQFITTPIEAYVDQSRRGELVDEAQLAAERITHDVRLALPNSIRVGCGGRCLEFLRAVSGGRYRAGPPGNELSFLPADADTSFDVLGSLNDTGGLVTSNTTGACLNGNAACVAIYNTGYDGNDAWRGDNIATLSGLSLSPASISFLNDEFRGGQRAFPASSPGQRFFIVDTPITFLCDPVNGTIRRYLGYSINADQDDVDTHAELTGLGNPAEHSLLANRVSECQFEYTPGSPTRNALLTARLSISEAGETISLLKQIHVDNVP